jgi:hypothetical protein
LSKVRVHELAKRYGRKGPEFAKLLQELGFDSVKSHMSAVDDATELMIVARLEAQGLRAASSDDSHQAEADDGLPKKKPLPGAGPRKKSLPPPVDGPRKKTLPPPAGRTTKTNMGATTDVEPEPEVMVSRPAPKPLPTADEVGQAQATEAETRAAPEAKKAPDEAPEKKKLPTIEETKPVEPVPEARTAVEGRRVEGRRLAERDGRQAVERARARRERPREGAGLDRAATRAAPDARDSFRAGEPPRSRDARADPRERGRRRRPPGSSRRLGAEHPAVGAAARRRPHTVRSRVPPRHPPARRHAAHPRWRIARDSGR